jgi:hypothetical protein
VKTETRRDFFIQEPEYSPFDTVMVTVADGAEPREGVTPLMLVMFKPKSVRVKD